MIEYGVIYYPQGSFRECETESQAREVFEHAPIGDGKVAVLIIEGEEVESNANRPIESST